MRITGSCAGGVLTLHFHGELDHHSAGEAMAALSERIDALLPRRLALDLKDLSFMDSSGIALILRSEKKMGELDGSLRLLHVPDQAMRVLSAAGLDRRLDITK